MKDFESKVVRATKELSAKEKIMLKDTTNAVKLDEATTNGAVEIDYDFHAEISRMTGAVQYFSTGDKGFGGDTTDIQTGSAKVAFFDQGSFQTFLTGFDRCNITAGAGTDHTYIKFFHRHSFFLYIYR
jgi:hypothetical protein